MIISIVIIVVIIIAIIIIVIVAPFQRHYHNYVQKMTHHLMHSAPLHGEGSLPIDMTRK